MTAVPHIVFHLDFISPYAYLAFERLPRALQGLSHSVEYRPLLFAGLLRAHGQLGPAEIASKRDWTYRQVAWLARELDIPLDLPTRHPFNPLALLRLALACGEDGRINRHVAETVFRHVWRGGADAEASDRLQALTEALSPRQAPDSEAVKQALRANTDAALTLGLFGVPSFVVEGRVFWGLDALPMLRACLEGDPWFDGEGWQAVQRVAPGITRGR